MGLYGANRLWFNPVHVSFLMGSSGNMVTQNFVDGEVAEFGTGLTETCVCDIHANLVYRLAMTKPQFEKAMQRLAKRRAARSAFVERELLAVRKGPFAVIDANTHFAANDAFEETYGREPLEAFVNDTYEIAHERVGEFIRTMRAWRMSVTPSRSGGAFEAVAARSFVTSRDLEAFQAGRRAHWVPSVRLVVSLTIGGQLGDVYAAQEELRRCLATCGVVTGFETCVRRGSLPVKALARPSLAGDMGGNGVGGLGEVGQL
jgi:hypothetical protein